MKPDTDVAIITSAHWEGDARLQRHAKYLAEGGLSVTLRSFGDLPRPKGVARALIEVARTNARTILLPDPELFWIGCLVARLSGKRAVIDIHEDYRLAARARPWIPRPLRPLVGWAASLAVGLGRLFAWRVLVAAPHLARSGDIEVLNIPTPSSMRASRERTRFEIVYVGDVTPARGAVEMVRTLSELDDRFELVVIGPIDPITRTRMEQLAAENKVEGRLRLVGRLPHQEAWDLASSALAGLNLLQAVPAYEDALATKLWEYMAVGVAPIVSDLRAQARLISSIEPSLVCRTSEDVAKVVTRLAEDPRFREGVATRAREVYERAWEESRPDLAIQSVFTP